MAVPVVAAQAAEGAAASTAARSARTARAGKATGKVKATDALGDPTKRTPAAARRRSSSSGGAQAAPSGASTGTPDGAAKGSKPGGGGFLEGLREGASEGRRLAPRGGSTVNDGAAVALGFLAWVWVVLPYANGGWSNVKAVLAAKFFNAAGGTNTTTAHPAASPAAPDLLGPSAPDFGRSK